MGCPCADLERGRPAQPLKEFEDEAGDTFVNMQERKLQTEDCLGSVYIPCTKRSPRRNTNFSALGSHPDLETQEQNKGRSTDRVNRLALLGERQRLSKEIKSYYSCGALRYIVNLQIRT